MAQRLWEERGRNMFAGRFWAELGSFGQSGMEVKGKVCFSFPKSQVSVPVSGTDKWFYTWRDGWGYFSENRQD